MLQIPSSHFKRRPHFPSGPSSCTSTSSRHNHVPTHRRRARRRRKKKVRGETTSEPYLPWLLYCTVERWGLELDLTLEAEKEGERERGGRGEREKKGKVGAWKNVCLPGHSFLCRPTDSSSHDSPLPPLSFSFAADSGLRNTPPEKGEETLPPTSSVFRAKPARLWRVGGGGEGSLTPSLPPSAYPSPDCSLQTFRPKAWSLSSPASIGLRIRLPAPSPLSEAAKATKRIHTYISGEEGEINGPCLLWEEGPRPTQAHKKEVCFGRSSRQKRAVHVGWVKGFSRPALVHLSLFSFCWPF